VMYRGGQRQVRHDEEQAFALAQEDSPAYLPGRFSSRPAALKAEAKDQRRLSQRSRLWLARHDPGLFEGVERFFRPNSLAIWSHRGSRRSKASKRS